LAADCGDGGGDVWWCPQRVACLRRVVVAVAHVVLEALTIRAVMVHPRDTLPAHATVVRPTVPHRPALFALGPLLLHFLA